MSDNIISYIGGHIETAIEKTAWIFGSVQRPDVFANGQEQYLPGGEYQDTAWHHPYCCVSQSVIHAVETWLNYLMSIDPTILPILESLGCIGDDGKVHLAVRFLAKMSGTIPGVGNSQFNVFNAMRKYGFVGEKFWPTTDQMTDDEYYAKITQSVIDQAAKSKPYFEFQYERILDNLAGLADATKKSTVVSCVGGITLGFGNLYTVPGPIVYNHQIQYFWQEKDVPIYDQIIKAISDINDSYEPYHKRFLPEYPFKYCSALYLIKKKVPMLYKLNSSPAIYVKHWSQNLLIPFSDGQLTGGDLFKTLYGVTDYSQLPINHVDVLPYPVATYPITTK